jgi:alpha-tubulin suppressor-like RCC1 family protein
LTPAPLPVKLVLVEGDMIVVSRTSARGPRGAATLALPAVLAALACAPSDEGGRDGADADGVSDRPDTPPTETEDFPAADEATSADADDAGPGDAEGADAADVRAEDGATLCTSAADVATGGYHTCVLLVTGEVRCWGLNNYGQLGDGTSTNRHVPTGVVGLLNARKISAGSDHTCALLDTGGVKCWGYNSSGQLGDGTNVNRSTPVDVVGLPSAASAIAAGTGFTCALLVAGGVKCWGDNSLGELGNGTTGGHSYAPVDVSGLASGVLDVAAGGLHACALSTAGGPSCWGANDDGQLGDGTTTPWNVPVEVTGLSSGVASVNLGGGHTCALLSTTGIKCWGRNDFGGELGDGTNTNRYTPVDVLGLGSGVAVVAAGGAHTCALLAGGGIKCWGSNGNGNLGDGTTTDRNAPIDVPGLASGVMDVDAGGAHTCAIMTGGTVKCWGFNVYGQVGDGTTTDRTSPVDASC